MCIRDSVDGVRFKYDLKTCFGAPHQPLAHPRGARFEACAISESARGGTICGPGGRFAATGPEAPVAERWLPAGGHEDQRIHAFTGHRVRNLAAAVGAHVAGHLNGPSYRIFGGEGVQRLQSLEAGVLSSGGLAGSGKHAQAQRRVQRRHLRTV